MIVQPPERPSAIDRRPMPDYAEQLRRPAMTRSVSATGDTPLSRTNYYRQCGLPAVLRRQGLIVIKADHMLTAITMPVRLASSVKSEMRHRGIAWGPIVAHLPTQRWTYLVGRDAALESEDNLAAELIRVNVTVVPTGSEIALPSPTHSAIERGWIVAANTHWPRAGVVLELVRFCAPGLQRRRSL